MPLDGRALTLGMALLLTALILTAIVLAMVGLRANQKVLEALAGSQIRMIALTDDDVRMRRSQAAAARETARWCREGVITIRTVCEDLPTERALQILER